MSGTPPQKNAILKLRFFYVWGKSMKASKTKHKQNMQRRSVEKLCPI
jgi:hypothetical protein